MRRGARALAAAALGACWTAPRAPAGSAAIPGAIRTTPPKPWRLPVAVTAIIPLLDPDE